MANAVTFELRAEDRATPTLDAVTQRATILYDQFGRAAVTLDQAQRRQAASADVADRGQRRLNNAIGNLTSASGLAATALTRVQGLLFGFAQGAVLGLAASALGTLAAQFLSTRRNMDDLTGVVLNQAATWDPYRGRLEEVRESTVALYNAQLRLAQLNATEQLAALEKSNWALEKRRRILTDTSQSFFPPAEDVDPRMLAENSLALEENRLQRERLNTILGLNELSLESARRAVDGLTPSEMAWGGVQADIAGRIVETNKAIRDSELGLRSLELAFRDNITLQAAHGQLVGTGAVQQLYGNQIIQHTTELQAMGGVVLSNYLERLSSGVAPLDAYTQALARANNEEERGILIRDRAKAALEFLDQVNRDHGFTLSQQIIAAGALSGATEQVTLSTLRHSVALEARQALFHATNQAIYAAITGQASLGAALRKAVAESLAGVASRALTEALFMTGIGIAASTPWGAALYGPAPVWFKGAATMAAVGVAAGAASRVAGAGQSASSAPSAGPSATPSTPSSPTGRELQPVEIIVNYHTMVSDRASREEFVNEVIPILGQVIKERAGQVGPVTLTYGA